MTITKVNVADMVLVVDGKPFRHIELRAPTRAYPPAKIECTLEPLPGREAAHARFFDAVRRMAQRVKPTRSDRVATARCRLVWFEGKRTPTESEVALESAKFTRARRSRQDRGRDARASQRVRERSGTS